VESGPGRVSQPPTSYLDEARRWLAAEPDEDLCTELERMIEVSPEDLGGYFGGRLQFGTAGLRAPVGPGPLRMNRLVVRQAAAGLARYLLDTDPDARTRGVVIAFDARRKSEAFALDTARVMAAMGVRAVVFADAAPTPVLAWSVTELAAAAGVVVTASHNPPSDNGYKVYLGDGAQIVAPIDSQISERIGGFDPLEIELASSGSPLIETADPGLVEAYAEAAAAVRLRPEVPGVPVAYTAMHGVGGAVLRRVFALAGFAAPVVVDRQHEPDGTFPTVAFPNPEEPGAMDLVIDAAIAAGAPVALAHDPDADRLGVAVIRDDGSSRRLGGDEIGWLLADHILAHTDGDDRLVVCSLVSSSLLAKMAEAAGVHHAEVFTGFKWIAREIAARPDQRFVFGYEQALGYLVTDRPRDKDGISAAVMIAEIAALAAAEGTDLEGRLASIAQRFGQYRVAETSVRMDPVDAAAAVARLWENPPSELDGHRVLEVTEYPEANLLRLVLDGGIRVQVRPSGTEPKVKLYGEAVDADPTAALTALSRQL
jgi:phosphomannomutase